MTEPARPCDPRARLRILPAQPLHSDARNVPLPIRVLAAVITRQGRLLLCQRAHHKRHGGLWEFPGGKVEAGESDLEAARRELDEELGVRVSEVGSILLSVADPGSDFVIEFLPVAIEGEPACLEHAALRWCTEEEILDLDLAPSDRRFALFRWSLRSAHPDADPAPR